MSEQKKVIYTVWFKDYLGQWQKDKSYKTKKSADNRLKKLNVQHGAVFQT